MAIPGTDPEPEPEPDYYATLDLSVQKDSYVFAIPYENFPAGKGATPVTVGIKGVSGTGTAFTSTVESNQAINLGAIVYASDSDQGDYKAFNMRSANSTSKAEWLNKSFPMTITDGGNTYNVSVFLYDGKVAIPGTDPEPEPEPVVCDYEVSGTTTCSDVWVPHTFATNRIQQFSIKYTNELIDSTKVYSVDSIKVLFGGNSTILASAEVRNSVTGTDYVVIDYNGYVSSHDNDTGEDYPAEIRVRLISNESDVVEFSVFIASPKYWTEVDVTSIENETVEFFYGDSPNMRVMLKGFSSVDEIRYDIPGVVVSKVDDGSIINGGVALIRFAVDWDNVVNGKYAITVNSSSSEYVFYIDVNRCFNLSTTEYDYYFVGVTNRDHGKMEWNVDEKDSLIVKAQFPRLTGDPTISATLAIGTNLYDMRDFVDFEVLEKNVDEKYLVFRMSNKALSIPSSLYTLAVLSGTSGAGGMIDLEVVIGGYDTVVTLDNNQCGVAPDWNLSDNDSMKVKITGLPELDADTRIVPTLYKDGVRISDYSSYLTLYSVYFRAGYILLSVNAGSELDEGSYKFVFTKGGNNYELSFLAVTGDAGDINAEYTLQCTAEQNEANTHLTVNIQKGATGSSLTEAKLLVIVKYQGGIVVNFYTTPQIAGSTGIDHIEVSTLNLIQVVIELVDGFQTGNPVYYGACSYSV